MNMQSQLKGRLARTPSFSLSTVELRGVSAEFDQSIKALPPSLAQPVRVPTDTKGRGDFLKQLAAKSAAKLAAGGTALILVLLSAETAQAQSSDVSLRTLDGVKSIEVLPDGTAEVTLENGAVMRLPAGSFTVSGSEVLVSEAVALQMTEAAAAGGGVSGGTLAAVGGGLALAGAAGGGGGGGSDGGGSGSTTAPTTGTVVDGYLVNATVFQDLNGNAIFDAGEPNTTTDAQGNYSIALDPSNPTAKIVSIGGTDSSTGQAFTGTLTAPAGSTVITPLTTLVQSLVEASADSDTPLTAAEANEQLAAALGLGSGTNLLELDPVEAITSASDPAAFAAAAQVASVISAAAAAQDTAEAGSEASEAAAASLAQQLLDASSPSDVLSDPDAIAEALESANVDAAEASAIASDVQETNTLIADADGSAEEIQRDIEAAQEVFQGSVVESIQDDEAGTVDVAGEASTIVSLRPVVLSENFADTYGPSNLDSAPVMSGTGRPGSIVRVTFSDADDATTDTSQTTIVDGSGNWRITFDAADFPTASGAYTVEVAAAPSGSSVFTVPAVSGGSFDVDLTPPAAPVLDSVSSDGTLTLEERESELTVSGTAEAGATVAVTIGSVTLTDTAAADGAFSVTFDEADIPTSGFSISAVASDDLGNASGSATQAISVEPESALTPTVDPVSGTLGSAELAAGLTVTGTGRAGSTITVSIDGADQNAVVGGDGTWSVTFAEDDLPDASGDYSVSAVATLPSTAFTSGSVDGGGFSVDLTAPDAPSLDTIAGNNALELEEQGADLTITGTAEAGATVEVTLNGVVETVVADAGGAFSVTFDAADVPGDDFSVSATATDALGNESSAATQPVTVEPVSALTPTITPVSGTFGPSELAAGLVVSGTGRAGSTVTVDIDGVTQDATVDGDGNWIATFAEADLPDATGDYTVSASATLAGTSVSSGSVSGGGFSVDLDAAAAPVLDAVAGNNAIELEESGSDLTVTGTTDEGATVEVTIGSVTLTDVAGVGGVFSVTFDAADVPTSDFSISAVASDDLGNTSASATQAISVEPVSALTPTVDPVSGVLGADDLAAGLTVTGTGRTGSTVTVTIDGEDQQAVVDGDGNWSVTFAEADLPATTGDYAVSAVATLPPTAFTSGSVDGGGFSVDVTAPDAPVIDSVAGDNALDLEEQGADLTITGSAEAFASVEVEINGVVETTVADDGGVFSVTFAAADVPDADFSVSATATDAAGNTGDEATQAVTVEPISTLTPTITPVSGTFGPTELAAGLVVSGMGRLGSTVTVTIDGQEQEAVVAPDGSWSVTFAEADLPDASGDYSVSAVATLPPTSLSSGSVDGGGFSVDVTAPDAPLLDAVAGDNFIDPSEQADDLVISGTAEAFSTVTVTIGVESQQATADVNGDFSVTFAAADVPTENFQVTAVAVDALGNTSATTDRSVLVGAVGQVITGTSGDDELSGTPGDDTINPEGNDDGLDIINGSQGDDEIDLSTSGGTSFVELNYAALDGPIDVTLDYASNTGSVDKGADGTDTLTSPETTGEAFGIGLVGTQGDDTFTVVQDGVETWAGIFYEGGDDTVNVTLNTGIVRVNAVTPGAVDEDVTADLTTGDITFASGSIDLNVSGSGGQIELETGDGDDSVTGSDADERFILGAGTDTLNAGGGFDTVRYDRGDVTTGVTVNLQTGIATGTWDGQAFLHNLSNVERVRGSRTGDDTLTAANSGSRLEGRGGDDTLIGGAGDDLLIGGDGADTFFVGRGNDTIQDYQGDSIDTIELDPAYTEAEIDQAVADAVQDGDAVVVTFVSTGATLRLEGWTVAELQAENAGGDIVGTSGNDLLVGTDGDDTIDPQGNDGNDPDRVIGSLGDDTIDLTNTGADSFVTLEYGGLGGPIDVTLDYALNEGRVVKGVGGVDGTDTLISPNTTGEANGIDIFGTAEDDTFTITQNDAGTFTAIVYAGGDDTVNLELDTGVVRVTSSDSEDVTADLTTGDITFLGGSIDLNVTGSGGRVELVTGNGDDTVTGSALDERFILGAGTDTLNAGDGIDLVRYDRSAVSDGVTVNLEAGTATGTWGGQAFSHSLSGVEQVRGSRTGGDNLTAADSGSFLDGRGGDDTLTGGAGDDVLVGGSGADTFVVGRGNDTIQDYQGEDIDTIELDPAYTEAEIDQAVADAVQDGDAVVVTFVSTGATLRLEGWTVAELQAENASSGSDIIGTFGDDVLNGTDGDDFIDPQGNDDGFDLINGSTGDDEIDFSNSGGESFVELNYSGLGGPITASIDYANNTGFVDKGADGFDSLTDPNTTGESLGIGLVGTAGNDTYNITQGTGFSWAGIVYAGGNDVINASLNEGIVRVDTSGEATTADLSSGLISFASGSIQVNATGSGGRIELRTFDEDDSIVGSDADERFILGAGTDTLNAGGGFDTVRYDRGDVTTGVTVNLQDGTATGTWDGQAFLHNLSNVEEVRGSRNGDDSLTAADTGSVLNGRGGNDTLIGGAGNDTLIGEAGDDTLQGNAGEDLFIVGRGNDIIRDFEAGIDDIELDNGATDEEIALAVQNAEQIGDDVRITLPDGATILFEDWTVANFQQEYEDRYAVNDIIGTDGPDVIDGTDGNDFIDPLSSGDGDDVINGSLGDDEFDLSNADSESFVELRYSNLTGPIEAFVDYASNQGSVNKFGDGFDNIISPLTPGEAFGLGITGTSGDDTINITQGSGFSWFGAFYAGGDDTINANLNSGIIRIDAGSGATTANLDTGSIAFAGGSIDLNVTGSGGRIELRTFDEDDNVTGSDRDERFILGAGTDVLNAGGGYDVVRYDRSDVTDGVTVNLATGVATGTWDGQAFTHTLSNVEEVRGSRTGNDTLTAADTGSVLEGRGGVDTYTGGASEDIFIVGEGHDVVYDFDIDVDQLQTRDGAFDFGLPAYEDVTFDGQPSLRFNFSPDDSVTLVGWSGRDLENSIAEELLSLTPGRMNNPATLTITGAGNLALIASDITEFLQTQSSTEFTFFEDGAAENYAFSITGTGLSLSVGPTGEELNGTVEAATLTLDGNPVWSLTDLGIPFADFAAMLDSATNEGAIDYSLGLADRDLIVVADDAAQDIRIEGVDHWIEAGGGDDAVTFNGGGNAAIIVGGGADTVDIAESTPAEDRAFIYIDPADSGTNVINGFRFTDSEDSGDRIVVEEDLAVFSIAWEVTDATNQGDLDSIAATFDPIGPGEYALFFDQSGNAVLQDLIESGAPGVNYTLGGTIASFTNADVSGLSGSNLGGYNIDGFLQYSEIDLPPASELV
ncbi:hypothetical protein J7394_07855 [Ruegeria sp. R13_0]|uniref:beta strand repeat-containing protein n=1 Tax=Ruegeria sp. R13_0 TaxID=2821099 RepID=UPI001ADD335F|nr:Ig-like domain-containing protein [Ruegeria sp. R13_0]MBO9434113.1 hypothetical protein [Ruegeria sp. R13_0]